jgi:pyruvate dehydrogenase E2 component (dihydrolipoamide acetyltransferase)
MRRAIGRMMARSKREIPHYYLSHPIELAEPLAWLDELNADQSVADRVLPAALLLRATVLAAVEVPLLNGFFDDDETRLVSDVNLAVAVSMRGGGLLAPVIPKAQRLGLVELMRSMKNLITRARGGALTARDMGTATITVTNLGERGVAQVFPIITPPQLAAVGFGAIAERAWASNGLVGARPVLWASLAADHRATDGHDGARFLATIDRFVHDRSALVTPPEALS